MPPLFNSFPKRSVYSIHTVLENLAFVCLQLGTQWLKLRNYFCSVNSTYLLFNFVLTKAPESEVMLCEILYSPSVIAFHSTVQSLSPKS